MKSRTSYKCNSDNNFVCEPMSEQQQCSTALSFKGQSGLDVKASPVIEDNVKGVLKVEALSVPSDTSLVVFMLVPSDVQLDKLTDADRARMLQFNDIDSSDSWKALFDSSKVSNGVYNIIIVPSAKNPSADKPWLDWAQSQVVEKN